MITPTKHEFLKAIEGDRLLSELEGKSWTPPCSTADEERAYRDAMRAILGPLDMPDPRIVAAELETADIHAARALMDAYPGKSQPYAGVQRVADDHHAPVLRAIGLIGWIGSGSDCGFAVTGFGRAVRRILRGDD